jgi:sugar O-acyltransferase (sialic acid O-acetyltransferase NeuD family)
MLIVGAKGFAKEVLEICHKNNMLKDLVFYDDINVEIGKKIFNLFPVLNSLEEAKLYFDNVDNRFSIGIGNPILRKKMCDKFESVGGVLTSIISANSDIGNFGVLIGQGCNIMSGSIISNDVSIGRGGLIYFNVVITHDCKVGKFVEFSPGVNVSGSCIIGDYSILGTNATLLPKIKIGKNVIIGAGAVVTTDIPDNCTAVGVPAKIIK